MPNLTTFSSAAARAFGLLSNSRKPVTVTFTSNSTWVAPAWVTNVPSMTGHGAAGLPPSYSGDVPRGSVAASVQGIAATGGNTAGNWDWGSSQGDSASIAASINASSSGSAFWGSILQYTLTPAYTAAIQGSVSWSNRIPGSAAPNGVSAGWKTSGAVAAGDYGESYVSWLEYGTTNAATTGAAATALGKTFAGGTGGAATPAAYTNQTVTPNTSYPIVVPAGGSVSITYLA